MHILPFSPCGLYSIRAQNGCGQHRPCKIVLLTLVTPKGVTDLYLPRGIIIKKRERSTIKIVELIINNHVVDVVHEHHVSIGT